MGSKHKKNKAKKTQSKQTASSEAQVASGASGTEEAEENEPGRANQASNGASASESNLSQSAWWTCPHEATAEKFGSRSKWVVLALPSAPHTRVPAAGWWLTGWERGPHLCSCSTSAEETVAFRSPVEEGVCKGFSCCCVEGRTGSEKIN